MIRVETPTGYHLGRTLSSWRLGAHDPTFRVSADEAGFARHTPEGPASVHIRQDGERLEAEGFGPGGDWLLSRLRELAGLDDDPSGFQPEGGAVRKLARKLAGMHLPRAPRVFDRVIQVTLQQLVTWEDACRSWGRLVREHGHDAPGPLDLRLPPAATELASLADYELVALGVRPRQARTLLRIAKNAERIESAAEDGAEALTSRLESLHGVGPWTSAYVRGTALADPDAVLLGDYNLCHTVAYLLAREPRADDARMLELLEPFRGHRFRVIRLIWMNGVHAPRRGPRMG